MYLYIATVPAHVCRVQYVLKYMIYIIARSSYMLLRVLYIIEIFYYQRVLALAYLPTYVYVEVGAREPQAKFLAVFWAPRVVRKGYNEGPAIRVR